MKAQCHRKSRGFTMIEMLVVIIIIGILAAILLPALFRAQESARQFRMTSEIKEISMAFETLAQKNGGVYPPTFNDMSLSPSRDAIRNYMLRAFPRSGQTPTVTSAWFTTAQSGSTRIPTSLDPAEAIVFWLSMLNDDPLNPLPFSGATQNIQKKNLFNFDLGRLKDLDNDGWPEFVLKDLQNGAPLVYFGSSNYSYETGGPGTVRQLARYPLASMSGLTTSDGTAIGGVARPYRSSVGGTSYSFVEATKFQIIAAGRDANYGEDIYTPPSSVLTGSSAPPAPWNAINATTVKAYPNDGGKYSKTDLDNLTNFSEGKLLGDARP